MSDEEQKYFKGLIGFTFDSDDIRYIEKMIDTKEKEIERLNNIINELEKDLKGKIDEDRLNILSNSHWKYILDKLQELKGSDKE